MIITLIIVTVLITILIILINKKNKTNDNKENQNKYILKNLISKNEKYFYRIIEKNFNERYKVQAQINLASIINKNKNYPTQYQNELYRNIDFGIFTKDNLTPLLLIEINDYTHRQLKRKYRDEKVQEICKEAGIKLITFYTEYSNKEDYIINRIKENLNNIEKKEEI